MFASALVAGFAACDSSEPCPSKEGSVLCGSCRETRSPEPGRLVLPRGLLGLRAAAQGDHQREVLFSDASGFPTHAVHVQRSMVPCTACHDWHGISALQGNPVNNAHLINFDLSIVRPSEKGKAPYTSNGPRRGSCSVTCHGKTHLETTY